MFKPTMNFSRGFAHCDFIRGQESDNWRSGDPRLVEDQLRRHVRAPINWGRHAGLVNYLLNQRHRCAEDDYSCARVFRAAGKWLEDNHTVGPFFLWLDSFDPHEPGTHPQVMQTFTSLTTQGWISLHQEQPLKGTARRKTNFGGLKRCIWAKSHLLINVLDSS